MEESKEFETNENTLILKTLTLDELEVIEDLNSEVYSFEKIEELLSNEWSKQFEGIEILRRIVKTNNQLSDDIAVRFENSISTAAQNLRSNLARNSFLLLQEIIPFIRTDSLIPFTKLLLLKSSSEKHFIKEIVAATLEKICSVHFSPTFLQYLMELADNKNKILADKSIWMLSKLVDSHSTKIKELREGFILNLLKWLLVVFTHKRQSLAKPAKEAILKLKSQVPEILDQEEFKTGMDSLELQQLQSIQPSPSQKNEPSSLKEAIKKGKLNSAFKKQNVIQ